MDRLCGLFILAGLYPLFRAWRGMRGTTLRHAVAWATAAWLTACLAWLTGGGREERYFALCLAACAGVAVLGARRPGVGAWNLVVTGLLAALSLPYLHGLGELKLEPAHLVYLGVALAVGAANYLPTRQGLTAASFGVWCAFEIGNIAEAWEVTPWLMPLTLAVIPWLALASRPTGDDTWRAFRDTFGFLWAQRVREQLARAAANAGPDGDEGELLRALLRRFSESDGA